jgi:uncharacterized protein DUF5336
VTAYGSVSRGSARASDRERALSYAAGALGVLMFIFGFLKWLKVGKGADAQKYGGYALAMPTTAVILTCLAAGLVAALGAMDRRDGRGVPSAIPAALALTSFLGAIGILLGKGSISPHTGDKVGVEVGLILGVIVAAVQSILLVMGLASRAADEAYTGDHGLVGAGTGVGGYPVGGAAMPPAGGYQQTATPTGGYQQPAAPTQQFTAPPPPSSP